MAALSALHPDDMVALMTFDKKATLRVPLTADRALVMSGVSKVARQAARRQHRYLPRPFRRRKISGRRRCRSQRHSDLDRQRRPRRYHRSRRARELWAASAAVDALVVSSAPLWDEKISQSLVGLKLQDVRRIADQTGGDVRQTPDVGTALPPMLERSRTRYTLFFRQPDSDAGAPGTLHHMKVDLSPAARAKHPAAVVRSRTAYYAQ